MKIVPVKGYTVPYPGKASKRKKNALRAAALLTATLAAAGGAACVLQGVPPVEDDPPFCSPEPEPPTAGVPMIDDEGFEPDPTQEVLIMGNLPVYTPKPLRPQANATSALKPAEYLITMGRFVIDEGPPFSKP